MRLAGAVRPAAGNKLFYSFDFIFVWRRQTCRKLVTAGITEGESVNFHRAWPIRGGQLEAAQEVFAIEARNEKKKKLRANN